eukprot:CAMPEP_0197461204 /NCGR_PEP_ID=MMETSP1175-20131217/55875_1 /TAXON_ID=1003142 /ORGANISM="Triceratium dubium, Strain CCMP147" /LENGTH=273 /DNA_ID=CAMNT_0042996443 /DNA_START=93 /DNA_END=914 /DNA_ORIENTATION=-
MITSVTRGEGNSLGVAGCTVIDAPCDLVWGTISDVESWPLYHEKISSVERIEEVRDESASGSVESGASQSPVGAKYRVSKLVKGRERECHFTVASVKIDGPTRSMKFYHDEGGMLSMFTLTVEPCDNTFQFVPYYSDADVQVSKSCRLIETAAVGLSCPLGKALLAVSSYPPFNGLVEKVVKRKLARGLRDFALAAERGTATARQRERRETVDLRSRLARVHSDVGLGLNPSWRRTRPPPRYLRRTRCCPGREPDHPSDAGTTRDSDSDRPHV